MYYPYSEKSITELQRDERHIEVKIHREHQDEHKVPKQDQASKVVTTANPEAEGRAVSPVVSKEKDLKPRYLSRK